MFDVFVLLAKLGLKLSLDQLLRSWRSFHSVLSYSINWTYFGSIQYAAYFGSEIPKMKTIRVKLLKVSVGLLIGLVIIISRGRDVFIRFRPFSHQNSSNQSPESKSCRVSESSTSTVNTVTTETTQLWTEIFCHVIYLLFILNTGHVPRWNDPCTGKTSHCIHLIWFWVFHFS